VDVVLPHIAIGDILQREPPEFSLLASNRIALKLRGREDMDRPRRGTPVPEVMVQHPVAPRLPDAEPRLLQDLPDHAVGGVLPRLQLPPRPVPLPLPEAARRLPLEKDAAVPEDGAEGRLDGHDANRARGTLITHSRSSLAT